MACREKVGVLINLHRFDDALELAESNYLRHPENTYHIDAYYKCLLRKRNRTFEDERLLDKLEEEAALVWVKDGAYPLQDGLKIQRRVRSQKVDRETLYLEISDLREKYHDIKYIHETLDDCMKYLKD